MEINIGFSPCPNDTFIFDALVHQKIDTQGIIFAPVLEDVEKLNQMSNNALLDVTKISFHQFGKITSQYELLTSGSALGYKNGPLLISKRKIYPDEISSASIAIPGENTTANLLLSIYAPDALNKKAYLFSNIEEVVLSDEKDIGLIIHENRFTYQQKGLKKIIDLGDWWEQNYKSPIPLGGIAIKKELDYSLKIKINQLIKKSVEYAFKNRDESLSYTLANSQEKNREIIQQHIDLYVNNFTLDLGETGKKAIDTLYQIAVKKNVLKPIEKNIFVV